MSNTWQGGTFFALYAFKLLLKIRIPLIFVQIDVAVFVNLDAVGTEKIGLDFRTAEGKRGGASAKTIDHPEARNVLGIGVEMKRVPHCTRSARRATQRCDLSVGCHFPAGDFLYLFVYDVVETHRVILCNNKSNICA